MTAIGEWVALSAREKQTCQPPKRNSKTGYGCCRLLVDYVGITAGTAETGCYTGVFQISWWGPRTAWDRCLYIRGYRGGGGGLLESCTHTVRKSRARAFCACQPRGGCESHPYVMHFRPSRFHCEGAVRVQSACARDNGLAVTAPRCVVNPGGRGTQFLFVYCI